MSNERISQLPRIKKRGLKRGLKKGLRGGSGLLYWEFSARRALLVRQRKALADASRHRFFVEIEE